MKIRFKGLAKLLKAVPNRAHLFPVKVLVNGKNKSFYAIRYKTGNKAMEIVLKQMRIPNDREALFDSKDGKAKNLSEKDVLNIYEKAGKPGSLNEFIQANFKKPIVKPRNSSTVDLDSKQMSIDDLINPAEEKNKKERYIKELKSKELKHDYKKARYVADESGEVLWRETELKYNLAITYDNKISEMTSKGQLDNLKAKTSEELEKELSDCRRLKELLGKGYSDNRKLNAEYWTKAVENGVRNLDDLLKFDEDFRNGKFDNKQQEEKEQVEKLAFRNVGMDGGLINFIKMREGTTRVESKGEYKQVKNINELVNQVKPLKDSHTKIKGRAIMDMFGISADLYSKSNNIPFPTGSVGYCSRQYNEKTGKGYISEIGLVADRGNSYDETKTAVHECMHAKLTLSGKNKLMDSIYTSGKKGKQIILKIEEPMVELAGQAVARQIHGDEANKSLHSYATFIADFLPRVWTSDIFKNVRKKGSLGIGQAIAEQLTSGNVDFINKVYDSFNANDDKKANSNRMKAIETKMLERTDKVEKIQNDTGVSSIANLVEELKRGTISLEGALNSSKYRELAAVLIAKFLEDEDLEVLEGLALSF